MPARIVITGSGRCGTKWTSEALTAAGIPCGHEAAHSHLAVGEWPESLCADSSWMAATMLDVVTDPVVLLVRHPLSVVSSWVEIGFFSWDMDNPTHEPLRRFAPHVYRYPAAPDRALAMWLTLTRAALARAEMILRIESIAGTFPRFVAWAGGDAELAADAAADIPPMNHHSESRAVTGLRHVESWDAHDARLASYSYDLARILGYGVTPER
jgi:hypothetical protein